MTSNSKIRYPPQRYGGKQCKYCGRKFIAKSGNQKYCSADCRSHATHQKQKKILRKELPRTVETGGVNKKEYNIEFSMGIYKLIRNLKENHILYGTFKTYFDAVKQAKKLEENNWNPKCKKFLHEQDYNYLSNYIKENHNGTYTIIASKNNKIRHYGTYNNKKDAIIICDYLYKNVWHTDDNNIKGVDLIHD